MPYRDMREFLKRLEDANDLKRVKREVDRKYEVAWVTKKSLNTRGPALLFENVKGYKIPVVTALCGTVERCYAAVESSRDKWADKWTQVEANPVPAKIVSNGPCKEVIERGDKIDLNKFPILWHYEKDGGYYLSCGIIITRDPDTRKLNAGIYRALVLGKDKLSIFINWQDGRVIARKYMDMGKPCPVAIVDGTDPSVLQSAAVKVPFGVNEFEIAGAIRGSPVEMVKCETIDLEVPATSELVIEGEFTPGNEVGYVGKSTYSDEGPFGEYTGYYGERRRSPIMNVKAVTHRADMVYHGLVIGIPPGESAIMYSALRWIEIYDAVKAIVPRNNIRGINIPPEAGNARCVVSIKKTRPMEGKLVAAAALASAIAVKKVVVVNDDIDPFDLNQVLWAEEQRSRWEDHFSFEAVGSALDPVAREGTIMSKVGVDATLPLGNDKEGRKDILLELGPVYAPLDGIDLKKYV